MTMENFERRRDRFEHFNAMERPGINITMTLEVPDFRAWCKATGRPPFHFFLYVLGRALMRVENFRYRLYRGQVIKIDRLIPSYTVMNEHHDLNFAQFDGCDDLDEFIRRSLAAKDQASSAEKLQHSSSCYNERDLKDNAFVTCMPWFEFTSIEHPMMRLADADIPMIAWGKYKPAGEGRLSMPFSIQAHHGFVDGYHMHQLAQTIAQEIGMLIGQPG
jgi:chloramphenicol O-acetyltransferase type A